MHSTARIGLLSSVGVCSQAHRSAASTALLTASWSLGPTKSWHTTSKTSVAAGAPSTADAGEYVPEPASDVKTRAGAGSRSKQQAGKLQADKAQSTVTDAALSPRRASSRASGKQNSNIQKAGVNDSSASTTAGPAVDNKSQSHPEERQGQGRHSTQAKEQPSTGKKVLAAHKIPAAELGTAPLPVTQPPSAAKSTSRRKQPSKAPALAGAVAVGAGVAAAAAAAAAASTSTQQGDSTLTSSTPACEPSTAATCTVEAEAVNLTQDQQFVAELLQRASQLNSAPLATVVDVLGQYLTSNVELPDGGSVGVTTGYVARPVDVNSMPSTGNRERQQQHGASTAPHQRDVELEHNDDSVQSAMDVYVPEVEVVNEVVDKVLGMRLPAKSFYGTRAQALAKLTIDECKAQCRLWLSVCGRKYASLFLEREPRLLTLPPANLLNSLQAISTALALDAPSSVQWALRNSSLVQTELTLEHLQSRLQELCDVLRVDLTKARQIAYRHTMLLTYAPGDLATRVELLAQLLPVEKPRLLSALAHEPRLMTRAPVRVATSLATLAAITHRPLRAAAVMLAAQPGLLGLASNTLAHKWQMLSRLACRHQPWADQLASMAPQQVARCLAASEQALQRLAFVMNYELQDLPGAQDLKKLLTCSNAHFKVTLLSAAQQAPRKVAGDRKAWRVAQARKREGQAGGDGLQQAPAASERTVASGSPASQGQNNVILNGTGTAQFDVGAWSTAPAAAVAAARGATGSPAEL